MWFAITLVRIEWTLCACGRVRNLPLIEVLVQALDPPDTELRWRAASALGEIGGVQAVKGLIRSLSDPNSDIRGLSAAALGKIGDSLAISALVQALSHPDKEVKKEAVEALKQISGVEALKYLIQYTEIDLYDPDILPLARTLVIRAKTTQRKTLFVSIFPKKLKLIDKFFILYRQLSRFFL
jgi:HEAT repeat protein